MRATDRPEQHGWLRRQSQQTGCSWGYVSAFDSKRRTIWIADAHRDDGERYVVRADEKLTAFVEIEREVLTVTFYLESINADSYQ
jgi:hypothetical protein